MRGEKDLADRVLDETSIIEWSDSHGHPDRTAEELLTMYRRQIAGQDPMPPNPSLRKRFLRPAYEKEIRPYLKG